MSASTMLAVTATSLRRVVRDRTALFFMVLLPIVVILVIGATVSNVTEFRVGVVGAVGAAGAVGAVGAGQGLGTDLVADLVAELDASPAVQARPHGDEAAARTALRRGELDAVLVVPAGTDAALRAGEPVTMPILAAGPESSQQAVRSAVAGVVADFGSRLMAAGFVADSLGGTLDERLPEVTRLQDRVPAVAVRTETVDATSDFLPFGFGYSAPTMLVLFVFINSLAGGAAIIQTRQLRIYERAMAAPVRARDLVLGETLSYFTLGLLQSLLIIVVGGAVFGVDWGDPLAAAALVLVWVLVGTGAGMLAGTVFRTPEQAAAIGPAVGIAFGMLGGTMWPLEIVTPAMRAVGHAVPHAWAVDGWIEVLSRGGGVLDIGPQLAVLAGFAAVLLTLASLRLGRRLTA